MKKEQVEMSKFIENTFKAESGKKEGISKNRGKDGSSKKKRKGATELRLKVKTPEEEIIRDNLQRLIEYRQKNTIKASVAQSLTKRN